MYTKYLTDRGQRLAFIETHKAMEHKKDSEKEYQRTQKLLDSSEHTLEITSRLNIFIIKLLIHRIKENPNTFRFRNSLAIQPNKISFLNFF